MGTWINPNTISYTYANPGEYTISANISNSLVYYTFTQTVTIMSTVNYLIPSLSTNTNMLVFQSLDGGSTGTALAQFLFSYAFGTKSGWDAYVTFWPGDKTNSSYGPFLLNMDFNANVSLSSLQYTYTSNGTFTATFFVSNPLGSKYFTLTFTVVYSLLGFYINVLPAYAQVGNTVSVNAYLIQGNNVVYNWFVNSIQFATAPKNCTNSKIIKNIIIYLPTK